MTALRINPEEIGDPLAILQNRMARERAQKSRQRQKEAYKLSRKLGLAPACPLPAVIDPSVYHIPVQEAPAVKIEPEPERFTSAEAECLASIAAAAGRPPLIAEIIAAVARAYSETPGTLTGVRRQKVITFPRHLAMYLAKYMTNRSFPEIGRRFGGRDHTTVLHGCKKMSLFFCNTESSAPNAEVAKLIWRELCAPGFSKIGEILKKARDLGASLTA